VVQGLCPVYEHIRTSDVGWTPASAGVTGATQEATGAIPNPAFLPLEAGGSRPAPVRRTAVRSLLHVGIRRLWGRFLRVEQKTIAKQARSAAARRGLTLTRAKPGFAT
jgi:hypothetical protein